MSSAPAWAETLARRIERVLDLLLGTAIFVMVAAMVWQVIGRYVFSKAPGWSEELSRFLMLWLTMLGAAAALRSGSHLSVTSLVDSLPRARWPSRSRCAMRRSSPRRGCSSGTAFSSRGSTLRRSRRRWKSR